MIWETNFVQLKKMIRRLFAKNSGSKPLPIKSVGAAIGRFCLAKPNLVELHYGARANDAAVVADRRNLESLRGDGTAPGPL